jgi:hypothetical protein
MPLLPGRGYITDKFRGVIFVMQDGERQIICEISNLALIDLATKRGSTIPRDVTDIYIRYQSIIQDIAGRKYDAGHLQRDGGILIRTSDLA